VRVPREERPFELASGESVWARELAASEELEVAGQGAHAVLVIVRLSSAVP
jgi:hypothetical protein